MSAPLFKEFFKPILTFMSDGEIHTNKELREKVIQYFKLNESEINETTGSGNVKRVEDRVNWTIQYLRQSQLIQTLSRGQYQINPRGTKVFKEDIDNLFDGKVDEVFDCSKGHPLILKSYLGKKTSLETLVICDRIFEYGKDFDKKLNDPVWETVSRKIKKYKPFLNIDVPHYKKILKEIVIHGS